MKLHHAISIHAGDALYRGVSIRGFTPDQEEMVRATVSRVPPELMHVLVSEIVADRGMGAKHGRFDPETKTVRINPHGFVLRQRFGEGPGWIHHIELTMVHEFGHALYESLSEAEKQEWYTLSGWVKGTKKGNASRYVEKRPGWDAYTSKWTHEPGVKMPRHYAEKNPNEQFADCFAFFLLGKPHQMAPALRMFIARRIQERVKRYPRAMVEGPARAYGERGN